MPRGDMGTDFAGRLKEYRKRKGLTQTQVADALGVHLQTVSKWERGVSEPDISLLGEIAATLDVTVEELAGAPVGEETFTGGFSAVALGKCIAALRKAKGESQETLAQTAGTSGDTVSKWERGVVCPDAEALVALAAHFGVPLSKLYYGISPEEKTIDLPQAKKRKRRSVTFITACVLICITAVLVAVLLPAPATEGVAAEIFGVTVGETVYDVAEGEWFTPVSPEREGYEFLGWVDESGVYQSIPLQITSDIEIFPQFKAKEYTIDLWLNGGTLATPPPHTFTVESGEIELPAPVKAGTEFEGWYLSADYSGEPVTALSCECADVSLYAKWRDVVYTVRYVPNGGVMSVSNPSEVTAGESVVLASPSRAGYVFLGWYDAPSGGERVESVGGENARNLTLYALWQRSNAQFKVTYVLGGGTAAEGNPSVIGSGEIAVLLDPYREHYEFLGWNTRADGGGEFLTALAGVDGDIILYAIWKPNEYIVIYETDGGGYPDGKSNPNRVTYGERVELAPLVKYGYTFAGWWTTPDFSGASVTVIDENNVEECSRLYAKFLPKVYSVTFDAGEGSFEAEGESVSRHTFDVEYGGVFAMPRPEREGYEFLRWVDEQGREIAGIDRSNIREGMTLTAEWKSLAPVKYFIVYDLLCKDFTDKGGNPERADSTDSVVLAAPSRPGYEFVGWNDRSDGTGQFYSVIPSGRTEDLTLYAIWQSCTVSGSAEDFEIEVGDTYVIITGYDASEAGENTDIVVPSEIEGKPVTDVQGLLVGNSDGYVTVRSVTLPETVERIGAGAFEYVYADSLRIPSSVTAIADGAFVNVWVKELMFAQESRLEVLGEGALSGITVTDSPVILPDGVKELKTGSMPVAQDGVILPDTLESIEPYAFGNITPGGGEVRILLPRSVKKMGRHAFPANYYVYTPLSEDEVSFDAECMEGSRTVVFDFAPSDVVLSDGEQSTRLTGGQYFLPAPEKPGHVFMGWQDDEGKFVPRMFLPSRGGEDVRLTAVWEEKGDAGEGRTLLLKEGETLTFLVAPDTYPDSVTLLLLDVPAGTRVRLTETVSRAGDVMCAEFGIFPQYDASPSFGFIDAERNSSSRGAVYDGSALSSRETNTAYSQTAYFRVTLRLEVL